MTLQDRLVLALEQDFPAPLIPRQLSRARFPASLRIPGSRPARAVPRLDNGCRHDPCAGSGNPAPLARSQHLVPPWPEG